MSAWSSVSIKINFDFFRALFTNLLIFVHHRQNFRGKFISNCWRQCSTRVLAVKANASVDVAARCSQSCLWVYKMKFFLYIEYSKPFQLSSRFSDASGKFNELCWTKSYKGSQKSMIPSHGTNFNSFYGPILVFRRWDFQWTVLRNVGSSIDTSYTALCSKIFGNHLNQQRSVKFSDCLHFCYGILCYARLILPERCFERVENLQSSHKRKHDAWRYLDN